MRADWGPALKAKISKGAGFGGVLRYAMQPVKQPEIVSTNMAGFDISALVSEFEAVRRLREDIRKPVLHLSLSCPKGETLSAPEWGESIQFILGRLGYTGSNAYVAIRHADTEHDHVHVVASRITLGGELVSDSRDVFLAIEATQEVEKRMGLVVTKGRGEPSGRKVLSKNEIEQSLRTSAQPPRMQLQASLDAALADHPSLMGLMERLETAGVSVRINQATTGRISGLSFALNGVAFKGSSLGKAYTWNQLKERIDYDQERDAQAIAGHCAGGSCSNEATGRANCPPGPSADHCNQPHRKPAGYDGLGPLAPGRATRPNEQCPDPGLSSLEELNRVRQKIRSCSVRSAVRASETGAVASARLEELQAEPMEIRPRRRPISRGAGHRLLGLVLAQHEPVATEHQHRHTSVERPNTSEMGSATTAPSAPIASSSPFGNAGGMSPKAQERER